MRLFVAIQLSEDVRDAIVDVQEALGRQGVRGKYIPRENLHLTLVFIGEYNDPDGVMEVIEDIPFEPFEMALDGIGAFGDLWWIGLASPSGTLRNYVGKLRHGLAEAGIPFDRKRFSPHITLLRRANLDIAKAHIQPVRHVAMIADRASLMRSDRGKNGMIYTEIV